MARVVRIEPVVWAASDGAVQARALDALESGNVLLLPSLAPVLTDPERALLSPRFAGERSIASWSRNFLFDSCNSARRVSRLRICCPFFGLQFAACRDNGSRQINRAGILSARTTEPGFSFTVIILSRGGRCLRLVLRLGYNRCGDSQTQS